MSGYDGHDGNTSGAHNGAQKVKFALQDLFKYLLLTQNELKSFIGSQLEAHERQILKMEEALFNVRRDTGPSSARKVLALRLKRTQRMKNFKNLDSHRNSQLEELY